MSLQAIEHIQEEGIERNQSSGEAPGMADRKVNGSVECSPARQEQEDNLNFFAHQVTEEWELCSDPLFWGTALIKSGM